MHNEHAPAEYEHAYAYDTDACALDTETLLRALGSPAPRRADASHDEPTPAPPALCPAHTTAPTPTSPHATALMARMQRLADNAPEDNNTARDHPKPTALQSNAAGSNNHDNDTPGPTPRDQSLAVQLADILDDPGSLGYYESLAARVRQGTVLPGHPQRDRRDLLLAKARMFAARRAPEGPIRNPAACFVGWVKGAGAG